MKMKKYLILAVVSLIAIEGTAIGTGGTQKPSIDKIKSRLRFLDGVFFTQVKQKLIGTLLATEMRTKAISNLELNRKPELDGIEGVVVKVANLRETERYGLTRQALQTDTELRLRQYGIKASGSATLKDFWEGNAYFGDVERITTRSRHGYHVGRTSLIESDDGKIYFYFRRGTTNANGRTEFQIFMGVSNDRGRNFDMVDNPVIGFDDLHSIGWKSALDPDVIKRSDGYYMVFEIGSSKDCAPSSAIAYSRDGFNWEIKEVLACCPLSKWHAEEMGSASVPSFVETPSGELYLQWVNLFGAEHSNTHHQAKFKNNIYERITDDTTIGKLNHPPADAWNGKAYDASNVFYEDGYYYMFYFGSDHYVHKGDISGIGLARTNTIDNVKSWNQFSENPILSGYRVKPGDDHKWTVYPEIIKIDGKYYLYYINITCVGIEECRNLRGLYRQRLIAGKPSSNKCSDGTSYGQCSPSPPGYCDNGIWVDGGEN